MAAIEDYSRPTTPDNASGAHGPNGTNGLTSPRTPRPTGLSLTEYTANPSPPRERSEERSVVPEAFLLPNGHPDVRDGAIEPPSPQQHPDSPGSTCA